MAGTYAQLNKLLQVSLVVMFMSAGAPSGATEIGTAFAQSGTVAVPPDKSSVAAKYGYVDPQKQIPDNLLLKALAAYDARVSKLKNSRYLSVVDFSVHSSLPRFFIIDMSNGSVLALHVAHGAGSDPKRTGYATRFSNTPQSEMSSLGLYVTAETYYGKHGYSLRLDGLSKTNSNVRGREIVIHGASYVHDKNVQAGRSWGCLAFSIAQHQTVIQLLKGGSLIYAGLETEPAPNSKLAKLN